MGIGVSLLLIAVGAILKWAVTASVAGISLSTVGLILLIVGVIGLLLSVLLFAPWGPRYNNHRHYDDDVPPGY